MGLLDGIEKLINEHGSATILKERIELANDKYAALERKLSSFVQKVHELEQEKKIFELENCKLKETIKTLETQIGQSGENRIDELAEKLLILLSSCNEAVASQLSQALGIGEQLATFHLEELEKSNFVVASYFYTEQPTIYSIAQEGRRYLSSNGLLK